MTHTIGKLFLAFLLWIPAHCAFAQPTFLFPDYSDEQGATVSVTLKVVNFENIVSSQFSIHWNPEVLRYNSVSNFAIPMMTIGDNFGTPLVENGILTFSWLDMALNGYTLADSTNLFSIEFDIVGAMGDTSGIRFSDQPTIREIADTTFTAVPTVFEDGMVEVITTTNTTDPENAPLRILECYPNPFKELTQVQLHIARSTNAHIIITNTQGQTVWEDHRHFNAGNHAFSLKKDIFPATGTYFLRLQSNEFSVTQKLILVQ
jgi:hypothetical protein